MSEVMVITSGKGGVGKTTTSINLSAALASKGKKVLALDMDPQGNMTSGLGVDKDEAEKTVYDLIIGNAGIEECICKDALENLDVLPSNINLSAAEIELIGVDDKEFIIRNAIAPIKDNYDYIIIDCPPSLGLLSLNALTASDTLIVPLQCEYYALEGLSQLLGTVRTVKQHYNEHLELEGVLYTMYDTRLKLNSQVIDEVNQYFPNKAYKTTIPRSVKLAEAPSFGKPIFYYEKYSKPAFAYKKFADEFLKKQ